MSNLETTTVGGLRKAALTGFGWTGLNRVGQQVIKFLVSVVLARILLPRDYGLVGMAAVFVGFAKMSSDLGLAGAIVQKNQLTDLQLSTALWLNLITGGVLWLLAWIGAPWVAQFYGTPEVAPILTVSALSIVFSAASAVPGALIYKGMDFKGLFLMDWLGMLGGSAISIGAAIAGLGVWSLVAGNLVTPLLTMVLGWRLCHWRPRLQFDLYSLRELSGFGGYYLGFRIFRYFTGNIDYLIIGRFFRPSALGIYTMAFQLIDIPRAKLSSIINSVMYPIFVVVQDDGGRTREGLTKTLMVLSLLVFPSLVGLGAIAPIFVNAVYGTKWLGVASILRVLVPAGMIYGIDVATAVLLGRGRAGVVFFVTVTRALLLFVALLFAAYTGDLLVAAAMVSLTAVLTGIPYNIWAYRSVGLDLKRVSEALAPAFILSLIMGAAVCKVVPFLGIRAASKWGVLLVGLVLGVTVYAVGVATWPWGTLARARAATFRKFGKGAKNAQSLLK